MNNLRIMLKVSYYSRSFASDSSKDDYLKSRGVISMSICTKFSILFKKITQFSHIHYCILWYYWKHGCQEYNKC